MRKIVCLIVVVCVSMFASCTRKTECSPTAQTERTELSQNETDITDNASSLLEIVNTDGDFSTDTISARELYRNGNYSYILVANNGDENINIQTSAIRKFGGGEEMFASNYTEILPYDSQTIISLYWKANKDADIIDEDVIRYTLKVAANSEHTGYPVLNCEIIKDTTELDSFVTVRADLDQEKSQLNDDDAIDVLAHLVSLDSAGDINGIYEYAHSFGVNDFADGTVNFEVLVPQKHSDLQLYVTSW